MAPLSGDHVGADEEPPSQGDASSNPGVENNPEDRLHPCRSAVGGFRQDKAIGVVGQPSWPPESGPESRCSGRPIRHVELAFFTNPVIGEIAPGMPIPMGAASPISSSIIATRAVIASIVA